jgi:ribose/xylose/arabinose/galactoside ABC-type transport system permease subunit
MTLPIVGHVAYGAARIRSAATVSVNAIPAGETGNVRGCVLTRGRIYPIVVTAATAACTRAQVYYPETGSRPARMVPAITCVTGYTILTLIPMPGTAASVGSGAQHGRIV